jgi:hypothetical protein
MPPHQNPLPRTEAATTQTPPQSKRRNQPFGLKAMWLHFAHDAELRRLAKLHVRIELKKANLSDLISERQTIMNRCIRRMRRSEGKN